MMDASLMHTNLPSSFLLDHPSSPPSPSHLRSQIVLHPQRYFNPTWRIATHRTPAAIATLLLATAAISSLPFFLLLTLRTAVSFHAGLLTLFHPWLATNHLHLMARVRHFILKFSFLFFERSSASISDAWRLQTAQSLTLGAAALATRGAGCARPWRL